MQLRKARPVEAPVLSALVLESGLLCVAEADEGVAGFYKLCLEGTCAELEHLWIRPHLMHRGIGRRLLRHALLAAEAAGMIVLSVVADPNAAGFYEREGGAVRGAIPAPLPGSPDRTLPVYEFQVRSANRPVD
jgi:N-acetylglutamate synthase-like GNAT family acetyltransferase